MVGNFISSPLTGIETHLLMPSSQYLTSKVAITEREREREMVVAHQLCLSPVKYSQSVDQNKSHGPNTIAGEEGK